MQTIQLLPQKQRQKIIKKTSKVSQRLKNPILNIFLFETFGTLVFSYGICVTQYIHPISRHIINPFWPFLISCFYFLGISISGPFTGGHINPSVTIGVYFGKLIQKNKLFPYIVSQIIGAILGTLIYYAFFQQTPYIYKQTPQFIQILYDSIGQFIGAFIFIFSIMYVDTRKYMKGQPFKYFFISLMLLVSKMYTFRKGCVNPAIMISLQIFTAGTQQNLALFYSIFGMVIGSILGGIIGALFYNKFFDVLLEEIDRHHYD